MRRRAERALIVPAARLAVAGATFAAFLLPLATPAVAQKVKMNLTRSFDDQPYQKIYAFFTATGTDALLTFTRVIGTCPDFGFCTSDANCHGGTCVDNECVGPVNVYPTVGQVAVIRKDEFCRALVCGSGGGAFVPPECDPSLYPCTTSCPVPTDCLSCPLAPGLCACDGGNDCPASDAPLQSSQVAFNETFQAAASANGWVYSRATVHPGTSDGFLELGVDPALVPAANFAVADGTVRFPLVQGQEYVLFLKHSFSPLVGGLQCYPFGRMELHFEGRQDPCDQDQDGYLVAQDCDDGNAAIHPGQVDASCNLVDEDCDGVADEDYVSEPDDWTPIGRQPAITSRDSHTLIGTGATAIAWGGFGPPSGPLQTGALYDPSTGLWSALPIAGAPTPRYDHTAVWTGSNMIVWGGWTFSGPTNTGGRYDPSAFAWVGETTPFGAPPPLTMHTAVWTGSRMIVWGGRDGAGRTLPIGGVYDPGTDSWRPTSVENAPEGRIHHTAVWTGSRMIVWGGETAPGVVTDTGAMYDPASDRWTPLTPTSAPQARAEHTAEWTGSEMIVWGGRDAGFNVLGSGGRFVVSTGTWEPVSSAGAPAPRYGHVAAWTGNEMLVWSGRINGGFPINSGGRYRPGTGTWSPMTALDEPTPRFGSRAVFLSDWNRMMVWGGSAGFPLDDGGLYLAASSCGAGACQRAAGTLCVNGSIQYQCEPGAPSTETCNGVDDDCDGVVDDSIPAVSGSPSLSVSLSGGAARLEWTPLPNGQAGDLVRGRVSSLLSSGGNFTSSTETCLANDDAARSFSDPEDPTPGDAYWYLAREVNFCSGPGTYDEGSPSQEGPRDTEIAASPGACP